MVTYRGREISLAELCRRHSLDVGTVKSRLRSGMDLEDALRRPVRRYPRQVERRRAPAPPDRGSQQPIARTLPAQLLEDAAEIMRECANVMRDIPITSRRQTLAIAACEDWLRRRAPVVHHQAALANS
jgi:hypothetical protein